ncbi:MAG: hypothetical protein ACOCV2_07240, partial [Persicimonas sp.]
METAESTLDSASCRWKTPNQRLLEPPADGNRRINARFSLSQREEAESTLDPVFFILAKAHEALIWTLPHQNLVMRALAGFFYSWRSPCTPSRGFSIYKRPRHRLICPFPTQNRTQKGLIR